MKFFISLGIFDLKYFLYFTLYAISTIIYAFICDVDVDENEGEDEDEDNIIKKHKFLDSLLLFIGYLLNFIPRWLSNKSSKSKEKHIINEKKGENNKSIEYIYNNPYVKYLSIKDISKVLFICIILLLKELNIIASKILIEKYDEEEYEDKFNFIPFLIIYLFSK